MPEQKHKTIWIEEPNNHNEYGLKVETIDEDGFCIVETDGFKITNQIYVYKSEIPKLFECIKELYN